MATSEAKKRGNQKHISEKLDEIKIRPSKGTKDRWKSCADAQNTSLQKFIIAAVESYIRETAR